MKLYEHYLNQLLAGQVFADLHKNVTSLVIQFTPTKLTKFKCYFTIRPNFIH